METVEKKTAPSVTHGAAEARAPRQRKRGNPKSSEEIGKDRWYPRKTQVRCHKFPKGKQLRQLLQRLVDFEGSKNKMPRKNEGRRRGGGSGRRKSGEFKTCKEGASFVRLETVRQARKKGEEEEVPRTGTNAEVRQLNGEVQRLNNKVCPCPRGWDWDRTREKVPVGRGGH